MILGGNDEVDLKWWIDASFAVHPDMRSHTGMTMSLGHGCPYSSTNKQKINTKSSTEAELVGVADGLPMVIWTRNFLEAQGLTVNDNVVYQDNMSAILLERNGRSWKADPAYKYPIFLRGRPHKKWRATRGLLSY